MNIYLETFDPKSIFPNCENPTNYEQTIINKIKMDVEKRDLKWIIHDYWNALMKKNSSKNLRYDPVLISGNEFKVCQIKNRSLNDNLFLT